MLGAKDRIFASNKKKLTSIWDKNYFVSALCRVQEVDEGILLPLRVCEDIKTINAAFEGGVCDKYGNFIAGHERSYPDKSSAINQACRRAYKISSPPKQKKKP